MAAAVWSITQGLISFLMFLFWYFYGVVGFLCFVKWIGNLSFGCLVAKMTMFYNIAFLDFYLVFLFWCWLFSL